jgi:hypothetical protein
MDEGFPGLLVAVAAGSHERRIARLYHSSIVTLRLQPTHRAVRNVP